MSLRDTCGSLPCLAGACWGQTASDCGATLVPQFVYVDYPDAGIGDYTEVAAELGAAGNSTPEHHSCAWLGTAGGGPPGSLNFWRATFLSELSATTDGTLAGGEVGDSRSNDPNFMPLEAQVRKWSCLVDLPGLGYSARLPLLLHSGRVILRVDAFQSKLWTFMDQPRFHGGDALLPWVHYVPLAADLSNLREMARWATTNASEAAAIGANARKWAQKHLTRTGIEEYFGAAILDAAGADILQPIEVREVASNLSSVLSDSMAEAAKVASNHSSVSSQTISTSWCARPVALLVSGQLERFAYKVAFSDADALRKQGRTPLQQLFEAQRGAQACSPEVDVFGMLSLGSVSRFNDVKQPDWPLSRCTRPQNGTECERQNLVTASQIELHYQRVYGARSASITLVANADLDRKLEAMLEAAPYMDRELTRHRLQQIPLWRDRWTAHGRMLLLRHLAYRSALANAAQGEDYEWYLYVREDNSFFPPYASLSTVAEALQRSRPANATALAAVDSCGTGSYSDKLFFGDRNGASLLFGETNTQFARFVVGWWQLASFVPRTMYGSGPLRSLLAIDARFVTDPLQIDFHIQDWLDSHLAYVQRALFGRTDVHAFARAPSDVNPSYCVPAHFSNCTSAESPYEICAEEPMQQPHW